MTETKTVASLKEANKVHSNLAQKKRKANENMWLCTFEGGGGTN